MVISNEVLTGGTTSHYTNLKFDVSEKGKAEDFICCKHFLHT